MGRQRKRPPRKSTATREQQIWDRLKINGPMGQSEIITAMGWEAFQTKDAIARLIRRDAVRHVGKKTHGQYEAIGERPEDGRGLAVGSILAMNRLSAECRSMKVLRDVKAPVHATAFAQAIAWLCPAYRVDEQDDSSHDSGAHVRPECAEEAA